MTEQTFTPGTPVKIGRRVYHHYAIVSDRMHDGKPMLISLSYRTRTVAEEPWDIVVRGRSVQRSGLNSTYSGEQVIERARARLGEARYNLIKNNCEHFVRDMLGLPACSHQLQAAAGAGASALLLALRLARGNPVIAIASTAVGLLVGSRFSAK